MVDVKYRLEVESVPRPRQGFPSVLANSKKEEEDDAPPPRQAACIMQVFL